MALALPGLAGHFSLCCHPQILQHVEDWQASWEGSEIDLWRHRLSSSPRSMRCKYTSEGTVNHPPGQMSPLPNPGVGVISPWIDGAVPCHCCLPWHWLPTLVGIGFHYEKQPWWTPLMEPCQCLSRLALGGSSFCEQKVNVHSHVWFPKSKCTLPCVVSLSPLFTDLKWRLNL